MIAIAITTSIEMKAIVTMDLILLVALFSFLIPPSGGSIELPLLREASVSASDEASVFSGL